MSYLLSTRGTSVLVTAAVSGLLASCSMKPPATSKLTIQLPSRAALASSPRMQSLSVDTASACFIISITGPQIKSRRDLRCSVDTGVFTGSFAAGASNTSISLDVPHGSGRVLAVYAYFRTSSGDSCPALTNGFGSLSRSKIAKVGEVKFDALQPVINVPITVDFASATMMTQQYTCVADSVPDAGAFGGRVTAGASSEISSPNAFTMRHRVSYKAEEETLTSPSGVKLRGKLNVQGL